MDAPVASAAAAASAVAFTAAPTTTTCGVAVSAAETPSELLLAVKLTAKANREVCFSCSMSHASIHNTHDTQLPTHHDTTAPRACRTAHP